MTHRPTRADVAADLQRCIYASFSKKGFKNENTKAFLAHAERDFNQLKSGLAKETRQIIERRFRKSMNSRVRVNRRREDLLTASLLLRG